jgi:AraC-like DNA-binding protein
MKLVSKFAKDGKIFFEAESSCQISPGSRLIDKYEEGDSGISNVIAFVCNEAILLYTYLEFAEPTDFIISIDEEIVVVTFVLNSKSGAWIKDYEPYLLSSDEVFTCQLVPEGSTEFRTPEHVEIFRMFIKPGYYMDILNNYGSTFSEINERVRNNVTGNIYLRPFPVTPKMKIIINGILNYNNPHEYLLQNFIKNKVLELFHTQLELILSQTGKEINRKLSSTDEQKITEAQKILRTNYQNPPTIRQLAVLLATNEFKLKKGFNQLYNTSVYQYIIEIRLEKAIELMYDKRISLEQISEMVGYANLSHFTRIFKKVKGITPGKFRISLN